MYKTHLFEIKNVTYYEFVTIFEMCNAVTTIKKYRD